jgi:predicted lipoprotein with Yx(FWY)xxD motif
MTQIRTTAAAMSITALAIFVAGCGGSSTTSSTSSSPTTSTSTTGAGGSSGAAVMTVSTASTPKLGTIIVTSNGIALYDFQKDTSTKSACYGSCAKVWPPLITSGAPKAAGGAEATKLGTIKRTDGTTQVTYNGHPLYTYTADMSPGEVNGNGITSFGGAWHALKPSGSAATASATTGGASTEATTAPSKSGSGSGGGGYGY